MAKIQLWKDKQQRIIDPTLFSQKAQKVAEDFAQENKDSKSQKVNKRTQIRKFYDEVQRLDGLAQNRPQQWEIILPQVHMLIAKAAYAKGRDLVSDSFLEFVRTSVEQITTHEDLAVFASFFEAFMGFYRLHGPKN